MLMSATTRSLTRDPVLADVLSLGNRLSRLINDGMGNSDWQLTRQRERVVGAARRHLRGARRDSDHGRDPGRQPRRR